MTAKEMPKKMRISVGSAIVLNLLKGKVETDPTTIYLMTYIKGKCNANCGFCPQARESYSRADMLSRVSWPVFLTEKVFKSLVKSVSDGKIKRVCIQALNYSEVFTHLAALARAIKRKVEVPISVSCQPFESKNIKLLKEAGVERIGIPLDAATKELFDKVKGLSVGGPYIWENQFSILNQAIRIFGKGRVTTHLIVGLGETEKEMVNIIQNCVDIGILPAIFAFTPILGTALENNPQPKLQSYRRIQIARHLICHRIVRYANMRFDSKGCISDFSIKKNVLHQIIRAGIPFLTTGCPHCNRPYYNEKPSGPIYNYPKKISLEELFQIEKAIFS